MAVQVDTREICDANPLSEDIERIALYRFTDGDTIRFFPEGRIELLFQLQGEFLHRTRCDRVWVKRPRAFVGGLHDYAYHVKPLTSGGLCMGVLFRPGAASKYIPVALNALKNQVRAAKDIWGSDGQILTTEILMFRDFEPRLLHIERFLGNYTRSQSEVIFRKISCEIEERPCTNLVQHQAQKACYSVAQFRKRFGEEIGIAPKVYAKIMRVAKARNRLRSGCPASLTELGLQLGYFDQSHFVREFKSVTGVSPSVFQRSL